MAFVRRSRKGGFLRGGVRRRETQWFNVLLASNTLAAATPVLLSTLSTTGLALRPFTVIRSRGLFLVRSDQVSADEIQIAAYGGAVVSDVASTVGVAAVPTPITDSVSDLWFFYQLGFSSFDFVTGAGFGDFSKNFEIDSRAMRKVEEGQDLITVVENSAVGSGVNVITGVRFLIKLH